MSDLFQILCWDNRTNSPWRLYNFKYIYTEDYVNLNRYLINHALRPYLRVLKLSCLFWALVILLPFWWRVSSLLTALVSLVLRKIALFPDPLWSLPANLSLYFWLRIVRFRAMFRLTVLIFANLVALPDEALEFLRVLSSSLSFSTVALMASESPSLIFWFTFFSTIIIKLIEYYLFN